MVSYDIEVQLERNARDRSAHDGGTCNHSFKLLKSTITLLVPFVGSLLLHYF